MRHSVTCLVWATLAISLAGGWAGCAAIGGQGRFAEFVADADFSDYHTFGLEYLPLAEPKKRRMGIDLEKLTIQTAEGVFETKGFRGAKAPAADFMAELEWRVGVSAQPKVFKEYADFANPEYPDFVLRFEARVRDRESGEVFWRSGTRLEIEVAEATSAALRQAVQEVLANFPEKKI